MIVIVQNEAMQHAAIVTPGNQVQFGKRTDAGPAAILDQVRYASSSGHQLFKQAVQSLPIAVQPFRRHPAKRVIDHFLREVNDAIQPGLEIIPPSHVEYTLVRKYSPIRGESA